MRTKSPGYAQKRSWLSGRALGALLLMGAASGCAVDTGGEPLEEIETVQSALVGYSEYSPNSPTAVEQNGALNMIFRTGNGSDPNKVPDAKRYTSITFDEAIVKNLQVMDATAFALCRDQNLPIKVFSINKPGALRRVVLGEDEGTLVHV